MLAIALATAVATPGVAAANPKIDAVAVVGPTLTLEQMVTAYDEALLPNLRAPAPNPPVITGDVELDTRIRALGEARGYTRRPEPSGALANVDRHLLQPTAASAWLQLRAAAATAGHSIEITSGYRSAAGQRAIWIDRMRGTSDEALDLLMQTVAVPGYSKHHTGYAIDLRSGPASLFAFQDSPAYAWLSENNFANAMAYGWLPSYPAGVDGLGPGPEPWEFVYVGLDNILCADFDPEADPSRPFCDTIGSPFADDIVWLHDTGLTTGCDARRYCTDGIVTRAEAATFLWRLFGRMEPGTDFNHTFDDVPAGAFYTDAVRWMVENKITTGTTSTSFSPSRTLTRAQFVTFLWRAAGRPDPMSSLEFEDVDPGSYAATAIAWAKFVGITSGTSATEFSPDATATRGQMAAFLHRFVDRVPV
jgi:hypothetical protein